jgi:hypothetical protein
LIFWSLGHVLGSLLIAFFASIIIVIVRLSLGRLVAIRGIVGEGLHFGVVGIREVKEGEFVAHLFKEPLMKYFDHYFVLYLHYVKVMLV